MPNRRRLSVLVLLLLIGVAAAAPSARAATPRYCASLQRSQAIRDLPSTLSAMGAGTRDAAGARRIDTAERTLARLSRRAPARSRRALAAPRAALARIVAAGRLSRGDAQRVYRTFSDLARSEGPRCHLPLLVSAGASDTKHGTPSSPEAGPDGPLASVAGVDTTLCNSRSDARVSVPGNFRISACWDGSKLRLTNRTNFVVQLLPSGAAGAPSRTTSMPQALPSLFIARETDDSVLPPDYSATIDVADGAGSLTVQGAPQSLLWQYAAVKVLSIYVPVEAIAHYADLSELVQALDNAIAAAQNCVRGANVLRKVACSAQFTVSAGWALASYLVSRGIPFIKDAAKKAIIGRLWGYAQTLDFAFATLGDASPFLNGAATIAIAAAPPLPVAPAAGQPVVTPTPAPALPPAPPVDRQALASYDRLAAGAPHHGWFIAAWQDFVATSTTLTTAGINIGTTGATPGSVGATTVLMRLCAATPRSSDGNCSATLAERRVPITNYGATVADFGDVSVNRGQRYWLVWYQPGAVAGQSWVTYWWDGGAGVSSALNHSVFVRGYDR